MRVTVKDAAQMLCPFIRDWDYDKNADENSPPIYEHIKCRGPVCMAWRWDDRGEDPRKLGDKRTGYCGMVGVDP